MVPQTPEAPARRPLSHTCPKRLLLAISEAQMQFSFLSHLFIWGPDGVLPEKHFTNAGSITRLSLATGLDALTMRFHFISWGVSWGFSWRGFYGFPVAFSMGFLWVSKALWFSWAKTFAKRTFVRSFLLIRKKYWMYWIQIAKVIVLLLGGLIWFHMLPLFPWALTTSA